MDTEYTVEVYRESDGKHDHQVDVFKTYDDAIRYTDNNAIDDGYYYSIWLIEYDDKNNETYAYPVY